MTTNTPSPTQDSKEAGKPRSQRASYHLLRKDGHKQRAAPLTAENYLETLRKTEGGGVNPMPPEPARDIASFKRALKEGYEKFESSHRLNTTKSLETRNHFPTHTPEARKVKPSVSDYGWIGHKSSSGFLDLAPVLLGRIHF